MRTVSGQTVNPLLKTTLFLLATVASTSVYSSASAQEFDNRLNGKTVLVTPSGHIVRRLPDDGSLVARRDGQGRLVYVDSWGTVVATEMPADRVFAAGEDSVQQRDRYPSIEGLIETSPDYFPPAPDEWGGNDVTTGSVPELRDSLPENVERQALPDMQPGDGGFAGEDGLSANPGEMASLPDNTTDTGGAFVPGPQFDTAIAIGEKSSAEITALQVFLDREGLSPGVIDGKKGSNVMKAIEAWQKASGGALDPNDTEAILERLRLNGGMPFTTYEITPADAAGPYVAAIPEDYGEKALLPALSYTSTTEMLAEKFHMDEAYLKAMNPGADFTIPGTIIKVINVGGKKTGKVAKILADKGRKQILAYDEFGQLIAAYPASIGSADTPSPSGLVTVERIALDPGYTYNPKVNFKQGSNDKVLAIPPGPNGPVGTVWIALSKPTYGIHGTPEPSKIGKTQSHGCIRMTNWDATELAKMTSPGVTVEFVD